MCDSSLPLAFDHPRVTRAAINRFIEMNHGSGEKAVLVCIQSDVDGILKENVPDGAIATRGFHDNDGPFVRAARA